MNVQQLIAKGSITGPYRKTRPINPLLFRIRWELRKVRGAWDDLSEAVAIARRTWAHRRILRSGVCPDEAPF